jgi:hypothetical protein
MGFLLGIATNCERDRRGPCFPWKRGPLGPRPPGCAGRPHCRARQHCRAPRSWPACRSGGEGRPRPVLPGEGANRPAARPIAARAGCSVSDRGAAPSVSTVEAPRPLLGAPSPARRTGRPSCSSDCTCRNDRRRFRSRTRTPSARPGTGSAAAKNWGSSDSLAGFFTPGKTQFKVEPRESRFLAHLSAARFP